MLIATSANPPSVSEGDNPERQADSVKRASSARFAVSAVYRQGGPSPGLGSFSELSCLLWLSHAQLFALVEKGGRLSIRDVDLFFQIFFWPLATDSDACHHYLMADLEKRKLAARRKRQKLRSDLPRFLQAALRMKKAACKHRGIECDLDLEWLQKQPQMCALTGISFEIPPAGIGPKTPSFDKIDPKQGYTKTNTRLVLYWINTARNTWTDEALRGLIKEASEAFHGNSSVSKPRS